MGFTEDHGLGLVNPVYSSLCWRLGCTVNGVVGRYRNGPFLEPDGDFEKARGCAFGSVRCGDLLSLFCHALDEGFQSQKLGPLISMGFV